MRDIDVLQEAERGLRVHDAVEVAIDGARGEQGGEDLDAVAQQLEGDAQRVQAGGL